MLLKKSCGTLRRLFAKCLRTVCTILAQTRSTLSLGRQFYRAHKKNFSIAKSLRTGHISLESPVIARAWWHCATKREDLSDEELARYALLLLVFFALVVVFEYGSQEFFGFGGYQDYATQSWAENFSDCGSLMMSTLTMSSESMPLRSWTSTPSTMYNTPRFSDRHNYGGMTRNCYICKKEENQNGKTI